MDADVMESVSRCKMSRTGSTLIFNGSHEWQVERCGKVLIMEDFRSSSKNIAPVCSCPDYGKTEWGSLTRRGTVPDDRNVHLSNRCLNQSPMERPQSRIGTLERSGSRGAGGPPLERPPSRGTVVYERTSRPGSRIGSLGALPQYEAPPSRRASATALFDSRTGITYERSNGSGFNMEEIRGSGETRRPNSTQNNSDYEQPPQLHSVCCAEWENGLGPQSEWDIDVDIRQHIQQCTCTCNHMGYGNFMDYQPTTCISELPDVAPSGPRQELGHGFYRGQNGSIRCNGRIFGTRTTHQIHHDSSSCSSKEDSLDDPKGRPAAFPIKTWCIGLFVSLLCISLALGIGLPIILSSGRPGTYEERLLLVRKILRDVPLIDGHNDLPWNIRKFVYNQILNFNFTSDLQKVEPWSRSNWSHTDLPRLRAGLMGAQFWSAYVPCEAQGLDAVQLTLDQVDVIRRLTDLNSEHLTLVTTVKGVREAHRNGKIASLIGVEGGHSLGNSLAVLRSLYNLGARYLTVTHACDTAWADCCVSDPPTYAPGDPHIPHRPGLSEFGKLVVREMNRLGMMIDLSHASIKTMKDALAASQAPVIFSHSSAHALCNSSRNVPDDILKLVALNGGLVMVSFYSYFVTCSSYATLHDVITHINHIRAVAGIDHVGIGAGYDGINHTPEGLEDVSKYPDLLAALLEDPSWSEEDVKKLAGLNLLRVFAQVEEVREKWRLAAVRPVEELIPGVYLEGRTDCMYLGS